MSTYKLIVYGPQRLMESEHSGHLPREGESVIFDTGVGARVYKVEHHIHTGKPVEVVVRARVLIPRSVNADAFPSAPENDEPVEDFGSKLDARIYFKKSGKHGG